MHRRQSSKPKPPPASLLLFSPRLGASAEKFFLLHSALSPFLSAS
jgi:hypothetical protein